MAALLPAARIVAATLARNGHRLTRHTLARALRTDGHPVSNARACALLTALRNEHHHGAHPRGVSEKMNQMAVVLPNH